MTQAETDILAEREKQRQKWGDEHDDEHNNGAMHVAASFLASGFEDHATPEWAYAIFEKHAGDRRRRLVIAAALLIAEIDRIDRAGA